MCDLTYCYDLDFRKTYLVLLDLDRLLRGGQVFFFLIVMMWWYCGFVLFFFFKHTKCDLNYFMLSIVRGMF